MRFILWLTALLFVAVAGVWPGFASGLAQFVAVASMFLLTGVAHLLAQPPLLALAAVVFAIARLARRGWRIPARPEAGR
ncbi:hypothetical protein AB0D27_11370 [Streptomyces sp. NPDC048415]|uniref:hypothetical protein n=1 Tax=Streptomyces sp. NPDC048415 TaxID=3154822 RepID=UPI003427A375